MMAQTGNPPSSSGSGTTVGSGATVAVGGTEVAVGGTEVAVGGTAVGGTAVGGTAVGSGVAVGSTYSSRSRTLMVTTSDADLAVLVGDGHLEGVASSGLVVQVTLGAQLTGVGFDVEGVCGGAGDLEGEGADRGRGGYRVADAYAEGGIFVDFTDTAVVDHDARVTDMEVGGSTDCDLGLVDVTQGAAEGIDAGVSGGGDGVGEAVFAENHEGDGLPISAYGAAGRGPCPRR